MLITKRALHIISTAPVLMVLTVAFASTASAETTLLAEFLVNGVSVTSSTAAEGKGEIILEDSKAGIGVKCSGIADGTVGADGAGEVTKILTVAGVEVTLTAPLLCKSNKFCEESSTDIEASPENLPISGKAFLQESGQFAASGKNGAFSMSCLVLGIRTSDECTAVETRIIIENVTGGIDAVGKSTPNNNCTIGGTESGEVTAVAGNVAKVVSGGTLSVSSE